VSVFEKISMLYETKFLISAGVTLAIEVPIVFVLAKYVFGRGEGIVNGKIRKLKRMGEVVSGKLGKMNSKVVLQAEIDWSKRMSLVTTSWNFKIIVAAFLASLLTLPYLWFVLPPFVDARYYLWIGEGLVGLTEAVLYTLLLGIRIDKTLLISLSANAASYFLGRFLLRIIL